VCIGTLEVIGFNLLYNYYYYYYSVNSKFSDVYLNLIGNRNSHQVWVVKQLYYNHAICLFEGLN
jgi:hypothetical protein